MKSGEERENVRKRSPETPHYGKNQQQDFYSNQEDFRPPFSLTKKKKAWEL
jgi:hypothetical protein